MNAIKLLYVDESGDPGLYNSPTKYFVLSAIIIDEFNWRSLVSHHLEFRKFLRDSKGLKIEEEIHASDFINSPGDLVRIKRHDRLDILKKTIDWIVNQERSMGVITLVVDKQGKNVDIFKYAWAELLSIFEYILKDENNTGMIITDNTDGTKLQDVMINLPVKNIIEDPILKHSYNSYFIQIVDVIAYFAHQVYETNNYVRRKGAHNFYKRLLPVLCRIDISNECGIIEK